MAEVPGLHTVGLGLGPPLTIREPLLRVVRLGVGQGEGLEHVGVPVDVMVARDDHDPGLDRRSITGDERLDLRLEKSLELGVLGGRCTLREIARDHNEIEPLTSNGRARSPP